MVIDRGSLATAMRATMSLPGVFPPVERDGRVLALKSADLTIAIDVEGFGSLNWRRADELIARGYKAAEAHRDELLKYRASDADWQAWQTGRQ